MAGAPRLDDIAQLPATAHYMSIPLGGRKSGAALCCCRRQYPQASVDDPTMHSGDPFGNGDYVKLQELGVPSAIEQLLRTNNETMLQHMKTLNEENNNRILSMMSQTMDQKIDQLIKEFDQKLAKMKEKTKTKSKMKMKTKTKMKMKMK